MARLKFFLLDSNTKKETPIFLSITDSGMRTKLKTKQKVAVKAWNKGSGSIRKNWTEYTDVQIELNRIELIVKKKITNLVEQNNKLPIPKELKKILEGVVFSQEINDVQVSFWEYFQKFIEGLAHKKNLRTGKPISKATIESYNQTFKTLKKFEDATGVVLSFATLSNSMYDKMIMFLEGVLLFSPNTVGKHIKNFKSIINNARDTEGVDVSKNYHDKYWRVIKQVKSAEEIVFLTENELNALWNLDLSKNLIMEKARDIFLVGSWTALRIGDIINLTESHFDRDRELIYFRTQKTDKQVAIPIHPVVNEILKKYEGKMPKISEPVVNENIKIVCEKIKSLHEKVLINEIKGNKLKVVEYMRYEKVTTHTGRRSFASNMYKRNTPIQQIMAITGHVKEADFFRYIGVSNDELAQGLSNKFKEWF